MSDRARKTAAVLYSDTVNILEKDCKGPDRDTYSGVEGPLSASCLHVHAVRSIC